MKNNIGISGDYFFPIWLQLQNTTEMSIKLIVVMIAEPFTLSAILWLFIAALVMHIARIFYEVYLTRPVTSLFRYVKKKLPKNILKLKRKKINE